MVHNDFYFTTFNHHFVIKRIQMQRFGKWSDLMTSIGRSCGFYVAKHCRLLKQNEHIGIIQTQEIFSRSIDNHAPIRKNGDFISIKIKPFALPVEAFCGNLLKSFFENWANSMQWPRK